MTRPEPHDLEHRASARAKGDRLSHRPRTLLALLRWSQREYAMEPPPRLHDRDIADDGAPDHTPEAKRYLGFAGHDERPDDRLRLACRTDVDGFYVTPLRCSLERVPGKERRDLLRATLPNVLYPTDAAATVGVPAWCVDDVLFRALTLLYDRYTDRPLPRRTDGKWTELSESEQNAIIDGENKRSNEAA